MPRPLSLVVSAVTAAVVVSGCGEEEPEVVDVGARITSAADALECQEAAEVQAKTVPLGSRPGRQDASSALRAWAERMRRSAEIPLDDYRVAVEEVGTLLFTHDTDGRADVAVVVARGEDPDGDLGWAVQSWARCRP